MRIQELQNQAMALCLELKNLSNEEYKVDILKFGFAPTFLLTKNGGYEKFQLWVNSSYTEYYQKRYLERNIVRLEQIKKDLFGEES